jgi:ubiquinone/menaquinone biosynthesis C-methylase UbiE
MGHPEPDAAWLQVCAVDKAHKLAQLLGNRTVGSVLEVGCASGVVLAEVSRRGIGTQHVGVDTLDPPARGDAFGRTLDLRSFDGVTLPFADRSFDLVFASHIVEHVAQPRALLAQMQRVARQFVYVEAACEQLLRTGHDALQRGLDAGHCNVYTPASLLLLLQTAGLQPSAAELFDHSIDVHSYGGSRLKGSIRKAIRGGALALSPTWAARLLCYHVGVLCEARPSTG